MANSEVKFRYLSQPDMIKAGVLDMHKCVQAIDSAVKLMGKGDYLHGGPSTEAHGIKLHFPATARGPRMPIAGGGRNFQAMPAYVGGDFHVCGAKILGSAFANKEKGLPRSISIIILNDPDTGAPIAIMEANLINAMRTGGMLGVGVKYLARKNSEVVGIIGAGVMNRANLMAIADTLPNIKQVKVFNRTKSKGEIWAKEMEEKLRLKVKPVDSLEEAVRGSDVVCSATAGGEPPFIPTAWLKEGVLILNPSVAIFEKELYVRNRMVVDNWGQQLAWRRGAEETGGKVPIHAVVHELVKEGKLKDEEIENLGPIALGTKPGRNNDKETIMLLTAGLPIQDIAWAYTVYQEAVKKGIGQELALWQKPYWA